MKRDHGEPLSYATAANHRPALEHLLVPVLPPRIISLEREPWIDHKSQIGVVLEADGDAGEVGVSAQRDLLNYQVGEVPRSHYVLLSNSSRLTKDFSPQPRAAALHEGSFFGCGWPRC